MGGCVGVSLWGQWQKKLATETTERHRKLMGERGISHRNTQKDTESIKWGFMSVRVCGVSGKKQLATETTERHRKTGVRGKG